MDPTRQFNDLDGDGDLESTDPVGGGILTPLVVRNNPATAGADTNYLKYTGDQHVVLGGTEGNDIIIASEGDDTIYGDGGNDNLEGGAGNDIINAGAGDDIVRDLGGDDNIKAGDGNDVVHGGPGLDLIMGGEGQDFIVLGTDAGSEVFAGEGNDFILGSKNAERILGNEGDDWIETGTFDGAPGDNFDEIFAQDGIVGHDVFLGDGGFDEFIAEGGDDIMVGSPGRGKLAGMSGWDWVTYKDNTFGGGRRPDARHRVRREPESAAERHAGRAMKRSRACRARRFNDMLTGADTIADERLPFAQGGTEGYTGSRLDAAGIARIAGLQAVLGAGVTSYIGRRHHPRRRRQRPHHGPRRRRHHRRRQVARRADRRVRGQRSEPYRHADRASQQHEDAGQFDVRGHDQPRPAGDRPLDQVRRRRRRATSTRSPTWGRWPTTPSAPTPTAGSR